MARTPGLLVNLNAFLDTIAVSELGKALLDISDDGYNVIVGSTVAKPTFFSDYSAHPNILVHLTPELASTAAGRYQVLHKYAEAYIAQLGLPDFGPVSQDAIAIQMIGECQARDDIEAGRISDALIKCSSRWASLPAATYGQHVNTLSNLLAAYQQAGGTGEA